jgi:pimeloyl-ACP methyl ester carboxylesterase
MRTARPHPPTETGEVDGLAWARFGVGGPDSAAPTAGVVILHGADSRKESHFDFARACADSGLAALAFDARGHGESPGPLDGRAIDDVARMADLLRERGGVEAVGLRGSSMGGYLALVSAAEARAGAVVAISTASGRGLAVGVRAGYFGFASDRDALVALFAGHDEARAAAALTVPLMLLHPEGDEIVDVEHSRALHAAAPSSTLVTPPGGHHRSAAHDPELQGETIRFLARALRGAGAGAGA